MSTTHIVREAPIGEEAGSGGSVAPPVGRWLALAATPTFAIMALWTALSGAQPDMPGMAMPGSAAMSGMVLMYLLMSVFHSSPWFKLIGKRPLGLRSRTLSL
ncbi:MAG TPA: hypothetical protein VHY19_04715 [Steroidobacteraceae bacterium]|jgi:hypothetical protein|nr:hypothetical protein [Steroidobacteraceae bacterium]